MPKYEVSYDLRKPGRNYESLWKRLGEWGATRVLQSVWIIDRQTTAVQIRDDLQRHMDDNDGILVTGLTGESAWRHLETNSDRSLLAA
jgi:hypothetical protein